MVYRVGVEIDDKTDGIEFGVNRGLVDGSELFILHLSGRKWRWMSRNKLIKSQRWMPVTFKLKGQSIGILAVIYELSEKFDHHHDGFGERAWYWEINLKSMSKSGR